MDDHSTMWSISYPLSSKEPSPPLSQKGQEYVRGIQPGLLAHLKCCRAAIFFFCAGVRRLFGGVGMKSI